MSQNANSTIKDVLVLSYLLSKIRFCKYKECKQFIKCANKRSYLTNKLIFIYFFPEK